MQILEKRLEKSLIAKKVRKVGNPSVSSTMNARLLSAVGDDSLEPAVGESLEGIILISTHSY